MSGRGARLPPGSVPQASAGTAASSMTGATALDLAATTSRRMSSRSWRARQRVAACSLSTEGCRARMSSKSPFGYASWYGTSSMRPQARPFPFPCPERQGPPVARADRLDDPLRELEDRHRLRRSDVEHLTDRLRCSLELHDRRDRVADVQEAAGLASVAVHLERLAAKGRIDEARDDHPVEAALTRADGVEQPEAHDRQASPRIREADELVKHLAGRIGPAADRGRAEQDVVVLALR